MKIINTLPLISQCLVQDQTKKLVSFNLWPKQVEAYNLLHSSLLAIFLKSRQGGFSSLTGIDSMLLCALVPELTVLILSISGDDSEEFHNRAKGIYLSETEGMHAFRELSPIKKELVEETKWDNGSRFVSLPAVKGSGMTADRVIIDEFFKINRTRAKITIREVLNNVVPTLDKRHGQLACVGTADGINQQKDMYFKGKDKSGSSRSLFFSCWDDPTMTIQRREQIVQDFGEDHANQEYPRTDVEAFIASGRPRFDTKVISEYYGPLANSHPVLFCGDIEEDGDGKQVLVQNKHGFLSIYEAKEKRLMYYISADVAEGLEKGDYTHAGVYEVMSQRPVATFHGHMEPTEFGMYLSRMGRYWNNATLIPERNKDGVAVIAALRQVEQYPDPLIHISKPRHKEQWQDKWLNPEERYGFQTTMVTKPLIIAQLAYDIANKVVPWFPEEYIGELYSYMRISDRKTEAAEGEFDDRVMEVAIGRYCGKEYQRYTVGTSVCDFCGYFIYVDKGCGWCKRSKRWCKMDDVCRLWASNGTTETEAILGRRKREELSRK